MFIQDGKINENLALIIGIKYNQIKREVLPNLDVNHFIDYLFKYKWKRNAPNSLTDAVTDIMNTDVENMVVYLSSVALTDSKNVNLDEFGDLFER